MQMQEQTQLLSQLHLHWNLASIRARVSCAPLSCALCVFLGVVVCCCSGRRPAPPLAHAAAWSVVPVLVPLMQKQAGMQVRQVPVRVSP